MPRHIPIHRAASNSRKQKPGLLAQSRKVFTTWRSDINDANISFEKESATERRHDAPKLAGHQLRIATSGSYILRLINPTCQDPTMISVNVPNKTRLLLTSQGIVTVTAPLETHGDTNAQRTLWMPVRDTRFLGPEDIGRQTDMRFGRVEHVNANLEVSAPYAYFSEDAQGLMGRMFARCVEVIAAEQHAIRSNRVDTATDHPIPQR